ncbi:MAG: hypothetical protein IPL38_03595 [Rhodobacter sp.]|nr:hypothetical protein [Rhodobacter sp.]
MDISVTIVHGLIAIGMINMVHGASFAVAGYAAWAASAGAKPVLAAAFGKTPAGNSPWPG